MIVNGFGYAGIHAFYPNMSKFFQVRFQFSNVQAGSISSLPYAIASISVPFFGGFTSYLGESYFEVLTFCSISFVFFTHLYLLMLSDVTQEGMDGGWTAIFPMIPFGFGHALFTTL